MDFSPSFTAVIEWENAKLSELGRTREMLTQLAIQISNMDPGFPEPPELVIVYDRLAIRPDLIQALAGDAFRRCPEVAVQLLPTDGATYYLQKNRGAEMARRDLILFVDSDVVPESGWLASLLHPFRDPEVEVACGNTYIEPRGVYNKAFAAFWFFPLRSRSPGLEPSTSFFANNVVFRRDLFLSYRFPDISLVRGQCAELARALLRDQHRIFISNGARVRHPPPNGFRPFVFRALCQGHDMVVKSRLAGQARVFGSLRDWMVGIGCALRQIWRRRADLGMTATDMTAAVCIALGYYTIALFGQGITQTWPQLIRKKFSV
jgi:glycosyltransferase involved in cell wall biosynthesis